MGQESDASELMGYSTAAAADRVVADGNRDPRAVRKALSEISEEGAVTQEAIDDALADLSKVVATPETRVEVARAALADAREAAAALRDTETVRSRLDGFETEISVLEERVDALGSRLTSLVERAQDPEDLYAIGSAIREMRSGAVGAQRDADALAAEIEAFERQLRDPDRWADELHDDIDAIEESIREPLAVATELSGGGGGESEGDPEMVWADATLRNRMQKLYIEDVRAEVDAVRKVALDRGIDDPYDDFGARLDELESLRAEVGRRLDEVSESAWSREHGGTIASFARTLEGFETPVDWSEVQACLESHRERLADPAGSE
jgi:chromosome segregation ATPase